MTAPVLHYFDCRSRGQAIRFALIDAGVAFDDVRIPVGELAEFRERARTSGVGGPFDSLPVLEWDGFTLAQTLAIASYLDDRLWSRRGAATAEARARLDMVTSVAHLDMQVPYSGLLWTASDRPREAIHGAARGLLEVLRRKLVALDALHASSSSGAPYFGGTEPAVADYFVYESLSRGRDVFGDLFRDALVTTPRMSALADTLDARPAIAEYVAAGGVPWLVTASPNERAVRDRLEGLSFP